MKDIKGFLVINKPKGITSYDVIRRVKQFFRDQNIDIPKIGHTGTLDPFATGVLVLCLGREYTKRAQEVQDMKKEYIVKIKLGAVSDTYDSTGQILKNDIKKLVQPSIKDIQEILKNFKGRIDQQPPMFSAKKIKGQRAYKLAREGKDVKLPKSKITIYDLDIINYEYPNLELKVVCSKGTYIRSLAHDIGQKLGLGAYAEELERISVGEFTSEKALDYDDISLEMFEKLIY